MNKGAIFILIFLCASALVEAQILDDSSSQVYGPSTMEIIYLGDLKDNSGKTHGVDTAVSGLERFSEVQQNSNMYQNLGNLGTALFPVFYDDEPIIGAKSGFLSYDPYFIANSKFKYYDTRSPFMDVGVVFGGNGRGLASVSFSQNVNPNWNFGVDFKRLASDKQIGAQQTEGDRNAIGTLMDAYTYYQHPEKPYQLQFHILNLKHNVDETGGVEDETEEFKYQDSQIALQDAFVEESRTNIHLFHDYGLLENLQVYHQFDRYQQTYAFKDFKEPDFYNRYLIADDSTYEQSIFTELTNEAGIKGSISSIFYRFYFKNRVVNQEFLYLGKQDRVIENYLGAVTRFDWKELFSVNAKAEVLQSGEYLLDGNLTSEWLNVRYRSSHYKQSNLVLNYFGNHGEWYNDFKNGFSNDLTGSLNVNWLGQQFKPSVRLSTKTNYVYFDQEAIPVQIDGSALIAQMGGMANFFIPTSREKMYGFKLNNEVYYSAVSGTSALRLPSWFTNVRVSWIGSWFNETVPVDVGASMHWRSSYLANTYHPALAQFYLQDEFDVAYYPVVDVFANFKIETLWLFVKLTHANMPGEGGYYVTPGYPGQQRSIDFGIRWLFFD
ncbi:MAG: hypothetical protein JXQ90_15595 [Cyclobacteriaceae bacterium]